jgi:hypothetical protein
MLFQLGKYLLPQTGGVLRVNPRVLNILVAKVISHIFNALTGL